MKITFVLLSVTLLHLSAGAYSQTTRLSLHIEQARLTEIFKQIEKQSEFLFFYSNEDIDHNLRVNVDASDKKVDQVLNDILQETDLIYAVKDRHIVLMSRKNFRNAAQAGIAVTGTISDDGGYPMPGVNVVVKNTLTGAVSDVNGEYSITVPDRNAVLVFSFVGYISREITVSDMNVIDVVLDEDTHQIEEVVVIGYGTTRRKDFTGSVSSVKMENSPIAQVANMNALESLKGNVAGLSIGATNSAGGEPNMIVRGQTAIGDKDAKETDANSASNLNKPLIILDGVIFMGSIQDINPNDIASIDVLKDATSAAAYGSRSANGVIAITTKKGVPGKPMITLNANLGIQSWQNKPEMMDPGQWIASVNARNLYPEGSTNWMKKGELENMDKGKVTDWLRESTRTGVIQDYQLAVSGASDRVNYYVSTAYSNNKGIVVGDSYDRISVFSKVKTNITDWLEVGLDGSYARADYSGFGASIYSAKTMSPYGVMYRDEVNGLLEKYPYTQSGVNPLWGVDDGTRENMDIRNSFRLGANALVKIPWVSGLSFRLNYVGNLQKNTSGEFETERYHVKEGEYDDETRYSPSAYQSLLSNAKGNKDNTTITSWVIDNILNYSNRFGKHHVDATLVYTRDYNMYEQENIKGSNFAENGNTTLGINGLAKATKQELELKNEKRTNIGYLGRLSYSYDDRYYITGSYRRDGASVFGANTKWGDFGAVGLAWRISGEDFMKGIKVLNDLKLKASWGQNGNQSLLPYSTLSVVKNGVAGDVRYQFSNTGSKVYYGLYQSSMGNDDLGWESTTSWNFGFESSWFDNRLFVDLDTYFSKTYDQLFKKNIPVMSGFKTVMASMGQINNNGIEATVRSVNVRTTDWYWTSSVTFWKNNNKLVKLYGEDLDGDGKEDDDIANSLFIGKSLGAIYGYRQDGIVQEEDAGYMDLTKATPGMPKYADIDGVPGISSTDREILGYTKENFRLNLSNTVNYKNFSLYVMITGTFGGNNYFMKSNKGAFMAKTDRFNENGIYLDTWTSQNRSNKYPIASFSDDSRFQGLQSRGFVRIQDISLAYTFNQAWMKSVNISGIKVFASIKNLATITNWVGGDPETGTGVRDDHYPVPTTYSIGTNITF